MVKMRNLLNPKRVFARRAEVLPRLTGGLYHLFQRPYSESEKQLAALHRRHAGDVGVIIGNGPSVRLEDLERLKGSVTFCCNRFHLAYARTCFRPDYTLCVDPQMLDDFGSEIVQRSDGTVLLGHDTAPNFDGDYLWFRLKDVRSFRFSRNVYDHVAPGGSVIIAAIQLAYFMGIRKLYLYGIDHSFRFETNPEADSVRQGAVGDGNHFIENYRSGKAWCPPDIARIEHALKVSDDFIRSQGGWIRNATRGGQLFVCERADLPEIF